MMARTTLFVLLILAVQVNSDSLGIEKKGIEDKWPVLKAILEKLFLPDREECVFYTKISSPTRSIDYNDPYASPLCDAKLPSGWYRFTQPAGDHISTKCPRVEDPDDLYCSSLYPGWMDGEHPSILDGKVKRKVCFHAEKKCCHASVDIKVRNCGIFYVYYLVKVPCPFRYCGGHARITTALPTPSSTAEPFPTEPGNVTTAEPFPTEPGNVTTAEPFPTEPGNVTTAEPFPIEPGNVTTAEPSTLPPFPPLLKNISTAEPLTESTSTAETLRTEHENITTTEPQTEPEATTTEPQTEPEATTAEPFPTEPESTTAEPFPTETPGPDECSNYKTLVETDRAASFYNPTAKTIKGDYNLQTNWYRYTGGAGNKMADHCVNVFHCGTHAPGWLRGGHPTNATRQAVVKDVCFHWQGDCCFFKGHILVRQCGDFFIYHLRKIRFKYLRYCGNGALMKH